MPSCETFKPRSLITRMFLTLIAAANNGHANAQPGLKPFVAETPLREATHSARHARRHGQFVGAVCRTIHQGRSRLCPCGSGKKYKRCHLSIDVAAEFRRKFERRATGKTLAKAA